jgi:hypothetical protein
MRDVTWARGDFRHRKSHPGGPSRSARAVPGAGRLVGGVAAAASQRRFGLSWRTFGRRAFGRRRLGVWAKALTVAVQGGTGGHNEEARHRQDRGRASKKGSMGLMLLVDSIVCGVHYYAESAAASVGSPPKHAFGALHNYRAFPTSLNIAISLSGTLNLPRLSVGGIPMARASSFSVGSARR